MGQLVKAIILLAAAFLVGIFILTKYQEPAVKLYVLNQGTIKVSDISIFATGPKPYDYEEQSKTLAVTAFLIKHKKGILLWDTGLPDEISENPDGKKIYEGFHVTVKKPLLALLKEINISPENVTFLGLSHHHFDHSGNANLFKNATLFVQEEELRLLGSDSPITALKGDRDVFGDGLVVIKRAVGHTPGHQYLFVNLPKTGPIVLSGDTVHFTKNWEYMLVPAFNHNRRNSFISMQEMGKFIRKKKATLWIQHDKEQIETLKQSPDFYL